MIALWLAGIALAIVFATIVVRRRSAAAALRSVPAPVMQRPAHPAVDPGAAPPRPVATTVIAPADAPVDSGFEWDEPLVDMARGSEPAAAGHGATQPVDVFGEAQRAKLRDRYLAARFPGVARTVADLMETDRVIQSARLYFEDRKLDRAIELLSLAIRQCPGEQALALARLEITFLMRSAALYVELAGDFRRAYPSSSQWDEVARLGRAIAPGEAIFSGTAGPRVTDHYGPWPDMPNWINAPWDLTAEVRATEFHQAMARRVM